ncbi:hypothetical protein [Vibrio paucivorans]
MSEQPLKEQLILESLLHRSKAYVIEMFQEGHYNLGLVVDASLGWEALRVASLPGVNLSEVNPCSKSDEECFQDYHYHQNDLFCVFKFEHHSFSSGRKTLEQLIKDLSLEVVNT